MIWYCATNVFYCSSTVNFGESLYFVRLWKTKRCVWRVELSFLSGTLRSPFMFSLWNSLSLLSLFYLLLLSNKAPISLYESRSTKKFETQEHLQPICMREEPKKKKMELKSAYVLSLWNSLYLFSLSFLSIISRRQDQIGSGRKKKKWEETPTNVYSEYLFFILFSPFLQNFFFFWVLKICVCIYFLVGFNL